MDRSISAADANRHFSHLLRSVREGESYVVTAHGKPVARIAPVSPQSATAEARRQLLERAAREPVVDVGRWSRDELYEAVRVALDTNVLAYAEGVNGADKKSAALDVLVRLGTEDVVLPVQVLGELFRVLVCKGRNKAFGPPPKGGRSDHD